MDWIQALILFVAGGVAALVAEFAFVLMLWMYEKVAD